MSAINARDECAKALSDNMTDFHARRANGLQVNASEALERMQQVADLQLGFTAEQIYGALAEEDFVVETTINNVLADEVFNLPPEMNPDEQQEMVHEAKQRYRQSHANEKKKKKTKKQARTPKNGKDEKEESEEEEEEEDTEESDESDEEDTSEEEEEDSDSDSEIEIESTRKKGAKRKHTRPRKKQKPSISSKGSKKTKGKTERKKKQKKKDKDDDDTADNDDNEDEVVRKWADDGKENGDRDPPDGDEGDDGEDDGLEEDDRKEMPLMDVSDVIASIDKAQWPCLNMVGFEVMFSQTRFYPNETYRRPKPNTLGVIVACSFPYVWIRTHHYKDHSKNSGETPTIAELSAYFDTACSASQHLYFRELNVDAVSFIHNLWQCSPALEIAAPQPDLLQKWSAIDKPWDVDFSGNLNPRKFNAEKQRRSRYVIGPFRATIDLTKRRKSSLDPVSMNFKEIQVLVDPEPRAAELQQNGISCMHVATAKFWNAVHPKCKGELLVHERLVPNVQSAPGVPVGGEAAPAAAAAAATDSAAPAPAAMDRDTDTDKNSEAQVDMDTKDDDADIEIVDETPAAGSARERRQSRRAKRAAELVLLETKVKVPVENVQVLTACNLLAPCNRSVFTDLEEVVTLFHHNRHIVLMRRIVSWDAAAQKMVIEFYSHLPCLAESGITGTTERKTRSHAPISAFYEEYKLFRYLDDSSGEPSLRHLKLQALKYGERYFGTDEAPIRTPSIPPPTVRELWETSIQGSEELISKVYGKPTPLELQYFSSQVCELDTELFDFQYRGLKWGMERDMLPVANIYWLPVPCYYADCNIKRSIMLFYSPCFQSWFSELSNVPASERAADKAARKSGLQPPSQVAALAASAAEAAKKAKEAQVQQQEEKEVEACMNCHQTYSKTRGGKGVKWATRRTCGHVFCDACIKKGVDCIVCDEKAPAKEAPSNLAQEIKRNARLESLMAELGLSNTQALLRKPSNFPGAEPLADKKDSGGGSRNGSSSNSGSSGGASSRSVGDSNGRNALSTKDKKRKSPPAASPSSSLSRSPAVAAAAAAAASSSSSSSSSKKPQVELVQLAAPVSSAPKPQQKRFKKHMRGGINSDDMGLGKTIFALALINACKASVTDVYVEPPVRCDTGEPVLGYHEQKLPPSFEIFRDVQLPSPGSSYQRCTKILEAMARDMSTVDGGHDAEDDDDGTAGELDEDDEECARKKRKKSTTTTKAQGKKKVVILKRTKAGAVTTTTSKKATETKLVGTKRARSKPSTNLIVHESHMHKMLRRTTGGVRRTINGLPMVATTLVLVPVTLIGQIISEFHRLSSRKLSILKYAGTGMKDKRLKNINEYPLDWEQFDIVVAAPTALTRWKTPSQKEREQAERKKRKEAKSNGDRYKPPKITDAQDFADFSQHPFMKVAWWRVIVDESHKCKNQNSSQNYRVRDLATRSLWLLTGTPIVNMFNMEGLLSMFGTPGFLQNRAFWSAFERYEKPKGDKKDPNRKKKPAKTSAMYSAEIDQKVAMGQLSHSDGQKAKQRFINLERGRLAKEMKKERKQQLASNITQRNEEGQRTLAAVDAAPLRQVFRYQMIRREKEQKYLDRDKLMDFLPESKQEVTVLPWLSKEEKHAYDLLENQCRMLLTAFLEDGGLSHGSREQSERLREITQYVDRIRSVCSWGFVDVKQLDDKMEELKRQEAARERRRAEEEARLQALNAAGYGAAAGDAARAEDKKESVDVFMKNLHRAATVKLTEVATINEQYMKADDECAVCLETIKEPTIAPCNHIYCKPCILGALSAMGNLCPLCKQPTTQSQLRLYVKKRQEDEHIKGSTDSAGGSSSSSSAASAKNRKKVNTNGIEMRSKIRYVLDLFRKRRLGKAKPRKTIVFSQSPFALKHLYTELQKQHDNPILVHSGLNENRRTYYLELFASDPNANVLLMSYGVGNVGLNLTCASHVIFLDPSKNIAEIAQAKERVRRIGQTEEVLFEFLTMEGSLEQRQQALNDEIMAQMSAGASSTSSSSSSSSNAADTSSNVLAPGASSSSSAVEAKQDMSSSSSTDAAFSASSNGSGSGSGTSTAAAAALAAVDRPFVSKITKKLTLMDIQQTHQQLPTKHSQSIQILQRLLNMPTEKNAQGSSTSAAPLAAAV